MATMSRRKFLQTSCSSAVPLFLPNAGLAQSCSSGGLHSPWVSSQKTLKVGFLWSLTGQLYLIEKPSTQIGRFWVDRVNRAGGIAGLKVEPVVIDARSDIKAYRQGVLDLLLNHKVVAVFGGYTSASRRAVMPLVTLNNGLFYYPTCYSGRECWQHIICTGPIANQHSFDLIPFMAKNFGKRAYFVGSNYVWPQESNRNARHWLQNVGGEVVAETYVPLGSDNFDDVIRDVKRLQPDWIFSTVVGASDIHFRQSYAKAGFSPDMLPTASLTTSEMEVKSMGPSLGEGHILSAPYFQSLDNPTNRKFVDAFLDSPYGESGVTHFNMEETYLSFLYFQKAVENLIAAECVEAISPLSIRDYSRQLELTDDESPEGFVRLDPDNLNSWLRPRIGRFNAEGQIDLLQERSEPIRPTPYLLYPQRGTCRFDGLHLPSGKIVKAAS